MNVMFRIDFQTWEKIKKLYPGLKTNQSICEQMVEQILRAELRRKMRLVKRPEKIK